MVEDFFGRAHYGQNLSYVNLNILIGSFASTVIGALETGLGSYAPAIWLFTALECGAAVIILMLARTRPVI